MIRLRSVAGLLLICASLVVTACGQSSTGTSSKPSATAPADLKTFRRGNGAEPKSLDPAYVGGTWENNIIGDMLIGLTTEDENGKPIPGAAESWETSEDGLTWTFHLRDHTWSDGVPVTGEDFVFGWRRTLDPKLAAEYAYYLYPVKNAEAVNAGKMPATALGISAPNAKTVVIQLENPAPYLPEWLTHYTTFALPKHVIEAKGSDWVKPGNYVTNGAFVLKEWVPNDHVTLEKNPRFYDAANVKIDRVIYYPTVDYVAGLNRFRAGELEVQDRLPAQQIDWIRANIPDTIHLVPILSTEYFTVNFGRKPLDDQRVRSALSLALDREVIVDKVRKLGELPAYGIIPPGIVNYPHDVALPFKDIKQAERLARAQALMKEAGYGPDKHLKTTLMIRSTSAESRRVPAAVQQMWRQAYIDVEIIQNDAAIFYDRVQAHDFDIAQAGWHADFNDASNFLDILRKGNSNNYGQYDNPKYDALVNQAAKEKDRIARGQVMAQAEATALADNAWVPIFFWVSQLLVQPYVKGWTPNAHDVNRSRWVSLQP